MTPNITPLIAGNWKMHGLMSSLSELSAIGQGLKKHPSEAEAIIFVPATLIYQASECLTNSPVRIGAQDCAIKVFGPHTGDISAEMLKDAGATYVIVGHSERRIDHGETDIIVNSKVEAAWRAGLVPVICIGETLEDSRAGKTLDVLSKQLKGSLPEAAGSESFVIAYEPIWAIGTGLTPTREDIASTHSFIRNELVGLLGSPANSVRLLYGGSVNPDNAEEILSIANVDGALVGRAAMQAKDFIALHNKVPG
ncbi:MULTISPECIES: triose-phosphate isomerase [unclassified Halomonas]|uniref:triose-phosphate isomerase n=1 Tax=unclassified Halomonas TaxID=2609666 RepID=UPI00054EBAA6|nr:MULTISPECIES: triose-phosphate isomerase [unclassified Halomonas]CEP35294.1 Triosephosphate isomerase-Triose-phosphate isomerase [Halomonas sp. R57-5]